MRRKLGNLLRLALCVNVLAIALSLPAGRPALAAGPPSGLNVTVTNTPLPVTGTVNANVTGNVGITGTPSVDVKNFPTTQPVSGTVNIGNFPASNSVTGSVNITGTPNVNVVNTAVNPVPTQNVGLGAATQVGQPASKLINLTCDSTGVCRQILPDGTLITTPFSVPPNEALVITDVQFGFTSDAGQGNYDVGALRVAISGGSSGGIVIFSGVVDGQKDVSGQIHLGTGVVVGPGHSITHSGLFFAGIQGYLVPNQ